VDTETTVLVPSHTIRWFAARFGAIALFALTGCMGGQTGGEIHEERPEPPHVSEDASAGSGGCEAVRSPLSREDRSLGFSADDVLAIAEGRFATEIAWASASELVTFGPETGTLPFTLDLSFTENVQRVQWAPKMTSGRGEAAGLGCPPEALELSVSVRMTSEGGALDETFATAIRATGPDLVTLEHRLDLESLNGSFTVTPRTSGTRPRTLVVSARFSEYGVVGALKGEIDVEGPSGTAGHASVVYGTFPPENHCGPDAFVVPLEIRLGGASAAEAWALVTDAFPAPLAWASGGRTTLSFDATPAERACLELRPPEAPRLFVPFSARVSTADERLDTTLSGQVEAASDANGVHARLQAGRACDDADLAACGIAGFERDGYAGYGVNMKAEVRSGASAAEPSGEIVVFARPPTDCVSTASSECPSRGSEALESGRIEKD